MDGSTQLIWGMIFGMFGVGYFMYGRKQRAAVPLVIGISLMIFPYFVSNIYILVILGVILVMVPYWQIGRLADWQIGRLADWQMKQA